jgi:simple sugar transport system ATP-binding protein
MTPLAELLQVEKRYGRVPALRGVSFAVHRGEVHCLLGDNGAGKSTLIKILAGVFPPDRGEYRFEGRTVRLRSPREALDLGIATVFQDLALLPLMSVLRNFILGREPVGRLGVLDLREAERQVRTSLERLGIALDDLHRPVGMLSGGQRQAVAIARAVHFGAKLLILDEPTSALGVRQAAQVLQVIRRMKEVGVGVVFITHSPLHALAVGDRFTVLFQGESLGTFSRGEVDERELTRLMAGGKALELEVEG